MTKIDDLWSICGFMKELSLAEIKEAELGLLRRLHGFCREHGIRYFLSHGTLLGAVKYRGFILWDDDVDVCLLREDYDRLLKLFPDDGRYRLFAHEKDPAYRYPYAKLCDMTTRKLEPGYDNGVELGVDIDIFPLDHWEDDLEKAKGEVRRLRRLAFCLGLSKRTEADSRNPIKRVVKEVLRGWCHLRGSGYYIRKIGEYANRPELRGSRYLGCKVWCLYGEGEIIPAEAFADSVELEFEGMTFPAPVGYEAFLTGLYGDYRQEPPPEKRRSHHCFMAYRRG